VTIIGKVRNNVYQNFSKKGARKVKKIEEFFRLKENGTNFSTELIAGLSTFFAMSYIIFVNPGILSQTGMPYQGVFLATVISSGLATLFIGLFANVPYALAPGMGLNAFFTYTVVFSLGFTWQEALAMVFICGLFNVFITVTKFRQLIIKAIPESLQHAIGAGIGLFVAYIGVKNAGFINFTTEAANITAVNNQAFDATQTTFEGGLQTINSTGATLPSISAFTDQTSLLALFGLLLIIILLLKNVKGAILIGIIAVTAVHLVLNPEALAAVNFDQSGLGASFAELGTTFGAAFGQEGIISLFSDPSRYPLVIMTIFAFSLSDVFDTIGTFIGTGRASGIFTKEDIDNMDKSSGMSTKLDKALFGDVVGTSLGAIFGTSNTTVYAESTVGISLGGRTGLTSVFIAIAFFLSIFIAPFVGLVPSAATAPALIIVGIMMMSTLKEIDWSSLEVAVPAFFASVFMAYAYSISYGIAAGFITYVIVKVALGKAKEVHPIIWVSSFLFLLNFIILAVL
jgi:AGZA family xanthine/uracil permease-like MFS transporter